jgi:hypothetical protein
MSHSLRWSCCALALVAGGVLGGLDSAAFGQYANYAQQTGGWTPNDYSAAYAPHTANHNLAASYNCGACEADCGCESGSCGMGCECGDCGGDQYGGGCSCGPYGDCGCGCYGGDGSCSVGDCGCDSYCDPCCGPPVYDGGVKCGIDPCVERRCRVPKVSLFGDYLYWQVSDIDVAHAQQQNGLGGAGTVPFGDIGTVGFDWEKHNYRVGGSIACGPCSDVYASYTSFDADSEDSVDAPVVPGGGGAVGSLVHHPGTALTASAGPVDASYELELRMGDLMCRSVFHDGPCHMIRWMVGGQYGHLEQNFLQSGNFSGGLGGDIDTRTNIDFDGGGLKAGIDAERWVGNGISVYGRATAAVMTGRFSSRYTMLNQSTDAMLAEANWKDDRAISQLEYEFGVALSSIDCHWRASVGYMLSYWDNVVTTGDFIDAVQADNYTNVGDSITFDGFVSRVEYRY